MKIIAEYEAGSKSYGLDTPESDSDFRYVFLNINISDIIGLSRFEHLDNINKEEDKFGFELRNFLKLLKKANSQCYELIFNDKWLTKTPEFDLILDNRENLLDSKNLFRCLSGYALSEKRQIFGTDTGKLGEKRKKAIEKFGYSFRNASHAIRLLRSGAIFFKYGYYPVNIFDKDKIYGPLCRNIKVNPQNYKPEELSSLIDKLDSELKEEFDNRKFNFEFNDDIANEICYKLYMPILNQMNLK